MQVDIDAEAIDAVVVGLSRDPMVLPSRYFYDRRGSALFDEICRTEEYYLTRTEVEILERYAAEMAGLIGPGVSLIELGSGASAKTRILLKSLQSPSSYVPVDISDDYLLEAAERLQAEFDGLRILPAVEDYTREFSLPRDHEATRSVVFFPGSSIGNFPPDDIPRLVRNVNRLIGDGGGFLVGIDLVKDSALLNAAYNDAAGVTAAFNINMLRHLNAIDDITFDATAFRHHAFYNTTLSRVEMHLIATRDTLVLAGDRRFELGQGADIRTEESYKFAADDFADLVEQSGLRLRRSWSDERGWFTILYFDR